MSLLKKYPLIVFFGLAYAFSWLIWMPLWLPYFGISALPAIPYQHSFGALGPMLAAFTVTLLLSGNPGLRQLMRRMGPGRFRPYWYLVVLGGPLLLYGIAQVTAAVIAGREISLEGMGVSDEYPEFGIITFFLFNLLFYGFGEETGWRGFALPALQRRYNFFIATTILTIFWAGWHIPLFFYRPGYMEMGLAGIAGWAVSLWTGSVLLSWLYNSTRGSILIVSIFHATVDLAFFSAAATADPMVTNIVGFLITLWGLGVLVEQYLHRKKSSARPAKITS